MSRSDRARSATIATRCTLYDTLSRVDVSDGVHWTERGAPARPAIDRLLPTPFSTFGLQLRATSTSCEQGPLPSYWGRPISCRRAWSPEPTLGKPYKDFSRRTATRPSVNLDCVAYEACCSFVFDLLGETATVKRSTRSRRLQRTLHWIAPTAPFSGWRAFDWNWATSHPRRLPSIRRRSPFLRQRRHDARTPPGGVQHGAGELGGWLRSMEWYPTRVVPGAPLAASDAGRFIFDRISSSTPILTRRIACGMLDRRKRLDPFTLATYSRDRQRTRPAVTGEGSLAAGRTDLLVRFLVPVGVSTLLISTERARASRCRRGPSSRATIMRGRGRDSPILPLGRGRLDRPSPGYFFIFGWAPLLVVQCIDATMVAKALLVASRSDRPTAVGICLYAAFFTVAAAHLFPRCPCPAECRVPFCSLAPAAGGQAWAVLSALLPALSFIRSTPRLSRPPFAQCCFSPPLCFAKALVRRTWRFVASGCFWPGAQFRPNCGFPRGISRRRLPPPRTLAMIGEMRYSGAGGGAALPLIGTDYQLPGLLLPTTRTEACVGTALPGDLTWNAAPHPDSVDRAVRLTSLSHRTPFDRTPHCFAAGGNPRSFTGPSATPTLRLPPLVLNERSVMASNYRRSPARRRSILLRQRGRRKRSLPPRVANAPYESFVSLPSGDLDPLRLLTIRIARMPSHRLVYASPTASVSL